MSEQHQVPPCQNLAQENSADKRTLCVNGCGFFGHPSTNDFCSKCFKDVNKNANPSPKPTSPGHAPLPQPTTAKSETAALEAKLEQLETKDTTETPTSTAKPKKKKTTRCACCRRKVGVLGFECRCDNVFCGEHRLPHDHQCTVDVKAIQQAKVEKENPVIEHVKFEKI